MGHNALLTGVSGYLGGTMLNRLDRATLPNLQELYAMVRSPEQAQKVAGYGATPLQLDATDLSALKKAVLDHSISIIFFLIDAVNSSSQKALIEALGEVRQRTGKTVHFIHTSGAKVFSSHAGHPVDHPFSDVGPEVYELQQTRRGPLAMLNQAVETNNAVIEISALHDVRSYIFVPCIVYGEGEGFGKRISLQTTAIVRVAKSLRQFYRPHSGNPGWPVCHILDNTSLYLDILRKVLLDENIGYGKNGYFLAASGRIAWDDLYRAMARHMAESDVVANNNIETADTSVLERMGQVLGCPKEYVALQMGGDCVFEAAHGKSMGWTPKFAPDHILETADAEVDLILKSLNSKGAL